MIYKIEKAQNGFIVKFREFSERQKTLILKALSTAFVNCPISIEYKGGQEGDSINVYAKNMSLQDCKGEINKTWEMLYNEDFGFYSSVENQQILSSLIKREVFCNLNEVVEYILEKSHEDPNSPFNFDDIENGYCPASVRPGQYCLEEHEENGIAFITLKTYDEEGDEEVLFHCYEEMSDPESYTSKMKKFNGGTWGDKEKVFEYMKKEGFIDEDAEVINWVEDTGYLEEEIEWWGITNGLAEKLKEAGEPVILSCNPCIWGRTCTGQEFFLDKSIQKIGEKMCILYGQQNSWSEQEIKMWRELEKEEEGK